MLRFGGRPGRSGQKGCQESKISQKVATELLRLGVYASASLSPNLSKANVYIYNRKKIHISKAVKECDARDALWEQSCQWGVRPWLPSVLPGAAGGVQVAENSGATFVGMGSVYENASKSSGAIS